MVEDRLYCITYQAKVDAYKTIDYNGTTYAVGSDPADAIFNFVEDESPLDSFAALTITDIREVKVRNYKIKITQEPDLDKIVALEERHGTNIGSVSRKSRRSNNGR